MENMNNKVTDLDVREEEMDNEDYMYGDTAIKSESSLAEKVAKGVAIGAVVLLVKAAYDKVKPKIENWRDKRDLARLKKRGYPVGTMSEEPTNIEYGECYEEVASEENEEE